MSTPDHSDSERLKTTHDHLSPEALATLSMSKEDRLNAVLNRPHFHYRRAEQILKRLERLMREPRADPRLQGSRNRMNGLMLLAQTNGGKSTLLQDLLSRYPEQQNIGGEAIIAPVVYVSMPAVVNEVKFYEAILKALRSPMQISRQSGQTGKVVDLLIQVQTKLLILDEFQHVGACVARTRDQLLNTVKSLGTDAQLNLVVAGIPEVQSLIGSDDQLSNRLRLEKLPLWTTDLEYAQLLLSFERALPLTRASNLVKTPDLPDLILSLSEGLLGEMAALLRLAAEHAILDHSERITVALLKTLVASGEWILPSRRRTQ